MRYTFNLLAGAVLAAVLIGGCAGVPDSTLAVVGSTDTVTVADFERIWRNLRQGDPVSDAARADFLDLIVDHRVKLAEARATGVDREPELVNEIASYRDQIATTYLVDKRLVEPGTRLLYDRRLQEVRFSHIIVRWRRNAAGIIDTAETRRGAEAMLERALSGREPFDTLIARYSEDPLKTTNNGSIGWLIAGSSLPQVDDIVYNETVGAIHPKLMASQFGYHVIKLTGRKKARQRLRASQILCRLDINNPTDTSACAARLSLVLDSLQSGKATFEALAERNSEDPVSGAKGGDLGWVERGIGLEHRFEEAVFNLPLGATSGVVRSSFGMHIIRVTDEEDPRPYEAQRADLRQIYKKERFVAEYEALVRSLLEAYEYRLNPDVVRMVITRMDGNWTTSSPGWETRLSTQDREAFLFSIRGRQVTLREAIPVIKTDPSLQMRRFTPESMDSIGRSLAERIILVSETRGFEERYPEFRRLLDEYRESAYIQRLEQKALLGPASISDDDIRKYWEANRGDFRWPDRVSFTEIYTYGEPIAKRLLDSLRQGADFSELASRHTRRSGLGSAKGAWGFVPSDKNELSKVAWQLAPGQVSGLIPQPPGYSIIKVDAKDPAREKTFDEARSEAGAKLRDSSTETRMRGWLGELRAKHGVRVYPGNLDGVFAKHDGAR